MKGKSQPHNDQSDTEWTTGNEEELSHRLRMTNMGALLSTLNTRMEGLKRRQDHMEGAAVSIQAHTVYIARSGASTSQDSEVQAPIPG